MVILLTLRNTMTILVGGTDVLARGLWSTVHPHTWLPLELPSKIGRPAAAENCLTTGEQIAHLPEDFGLLLDITLEEETHKLDGQVGRQARHLTAALGTEQHSAIRIRRPMLTGSAQQERMTCKDQLAAIMSSLEMSLQVSNLISHLDHSC